MKTRIYYFSGTGNCRAAAEGIARGIGGELREITWAESEPVEEGVRVGLVFPVYFLAVPRIVRNFAEGLRLPPRTPSFAVATMGLRQGNALHQARALLLRAGAASFSGYSLQMPDNSIVFPTREGEIPGMLEAAKAGIERIVADLSRSCEGDRPVWNPFAALGGSLMKAYCEGILGFRDIRASEECTGCGLCAKACPVGNIRMEGVRPLWNNRCASCFACIHRCPAKAAGFRGMKQGSFIPYVHPDHALSLQAPQDR